MLSNELIHVGKVTSATLFITNVSKIRYASIHAQVLMEAGEFSLLVQQKMEDFMSWQSNIRPESARRERLNFLFKQRDSPSYNCWYTTEKESKLK